MKRATFHTTSFTTAPPTTTPSLVASARLAPSLWRATPFSAWARPTTKRALSATVAGDWFTLLETATKQFQFNLILVCVSSQAFTPGQKATFTTREHLCPKCAKVPVATVKPTQSNLDDSGYHPGIFKEQHQTPPPAIIEEPGTPTGIFGLSVRHVSNGEIFSRIPSLRFLSSGDPCWPDFARTGHTVAHLVLQVPHVWLGFARRIHGKVRVCFIPSINLFIYAQFSYKMNKFPLETGQYM